MDEDIFFFFEKKAKDEDIFDNKFTENGFRVVEEEVAEGASLTQSSLVAPTPVMSHIVTIHIDSHDKIGLKKEQW